MLRKLGIALAVVVAFGAGGFALVRMMDAGATEFRVEGDALHISGPVSGAASDRLERLLDENPGIAAVALGDIPGADDVAWVTGMGRMIRAAGLETRATGIVVNDGLFLFLGGASRSVAQGGALVLHSDAVQRQAGVAADVSSAAEADRVRFVEAMLGDAGFAAFMAETRASRDSYELTGDDLARFGLATAN
jgi:hypothetical protein